VAVKSAEEARISRYVLASWPASAALDMLEGGWVIVVWAKAVTVQTISNGSAIASDMGEYLVFIERSPLKWRILSG
jgi:hypothetical protein